MNACSHSEMVAGTRNFVAVILLSRFLFRRNRKEHRDRYLLQTKLTVEINSCMRMGGQLKVAEKAVRNENSASSSRTPY